MQLSEPILLPKFYQLFHFHAGRPILINYPREGKTENGKGEFSQTEWIGCLEHSMWTICSPLSQFCCPNLSTFSLSCWEASSYYPREGMAENGKGEFQTNELCSTSLKSHSSLVS